MSERRMPRTIVGLSEQEILWVINDHVATLERAWPEGTIGPGDDAAVVAAPDGRVVISIDAMSQDRDFRLHWPAGVIDTGYSTGWKAVAQNLSDMNAMGARATSIVTALTMPGDTPLNWIRSFTTGLVGAIRHLGATQCRIAGGDLGSGNVITIAITVTGDLEGREPARRQMPETDLFQTMDLDLVHTGNVGWAAAGLAVLETPRTTLESLVGQHPNKSKIIRTMVKAIRAQLRPRPPLEHGPASSGQVSCMMDVSDGVSRDMWRLASPNGLVPELDAEWVRNQAEDLDPLAKLLGQDAQDWVCHGGEDYGLLGAIPQDMPAPIGWSRCGVLRRNKGNEVTGVGQPSAGGWDHFSE